MRFSTDLVTGDKCRVVLGYFVNFKGSAIYCCIYVNINAVTYIFGISWKQCSPVYLGAVQ